MSKKQVPLDEKIFRALIENSFDALALVSHGGIFTYVK